MGLFVFLPKKDKATKGRKKPVNRRAMDPKWDLERMRRGWHIGGLVVAVLTFTVGWVIVRGALVDALLEAKQAEAVAQADSQPPQRGPKSQLENQPVWLTESIANPILQRVDQMVANDPFDGSDLQNAADMLAQEPWIESVQQVRRDLTGQVHVDVTFREPIAAVQDSRNRGDVYLIDHHGVVITGPWSWQQAHDQDFIVLEGTQNAPPALGQKWEGQDLQDALALSLVLKQQDYHQQVAAVHVVDNPRTPAGHDLVIYTTSEAAVLWGAPIGHAPETEFITDKSKLDNIQAVYEKYGQISSRKGTLEVNHASPVIRSGQL